MRKQVTVAAAVPTVWNMVLALLTEPGQELNYLKLARFSSVLPSVHPCR